MNAESDILNLDQNGDDRCGHKSRKRCCVATGEVRDPDIMVRYVLSPDDQVMADVYGKLPGRGVWVSANEGLLRQAVKTGGFARGFKKKISVDPDALVAQTREQLRRHMLGQLTMTRKGGRLIYGQTGVREPASRGDVALRIEASDGAPDGRGKLRTLSLAMARELGRPDPAVIGCFTALEIGTALGRDPVVHAAILVGPMVKAMQASARRLSGFVSLVPPDWPDVVHEISLEPPPPKKPPTKSG